MLTDMKWGSTQQHNTTPPKGKRTQEEEGAVQEDAGQDRAGEGSFAGPSGTSGDGASAEVAVLGEDSEDSGEEAVQEPADGPVGVRTVVAGTVAPSKSTSRREQARMARQRRLDATDAEYRRLVALEEEEDTQSTGATTTSSTGTAASSSVTPRDASMRSAPAGPSRANKANRHRQATERPAAPHRSYHWLEKNKDLSSDEQFQDS
ncbi:uncharacterized protein LOC144752802 [Lissotriton helveticus]